MKVYELTKDGHGLYAFEVENSYIQPRKIALLLSRLNGVSDIERRALFQTPSDIHLEFKYKEIDFILLEPFGDNSRYWVGPKNDSEMLDIKPLVDVFKRYKVPVLIRIMGDIITLNLKSLFGFKSSQ